MAKLCGTNDIVVLSALSVRPDLSAKEIKREYGMAAGREIAFGALYTLLARLERARILRGKQLPYRPVSGGRTVRVYALTPAGKSQLARMKKTFLKLWERR